MTAPFRGLPAAAGADDLHKVDDADEVAAARARHPSASWHPDHDLLRRRLARRMAGAGHPRPLLGATVVAVRGLLAMDREQFAAALGLPADEVDALERGCDPRTDGRLRS